LSTNTERQAIGFREIASGLQVPEGPVALSDGGVLVVEILGGWLTRIFPDGSMARIVQLGGGPNGAAIGPDGKCYVCNSGGFSWVERDGLRIPVAEAPENAVAGSIQRVDLDSGRFETLYGEANGRALRSPNDLVFDSSGGFWFTDYGKVYDRVRDRGAVYYARADGSFIEEVIAPLDSPNGIGLSSDGTALFVAETYTGNILRFGIDGPGRIRRPDGQTAAMGATVIGRAGACRYPDSLAVDSAGNVCVATAGAGGILVLSPDGSGAQQIELPDPLTSNICFGGPGLRTAYVTFGLSGRLVAFEWPRPGAPLHFNR
jgi:gluconolactonase